jgi:hypothetical protein
MFVDGRLLVPSVGRLVSPPTRLGGSSDKDTRKGAPGSTGSSSAQQEHGAVMMRPAVGVRKATLATRRKHGGSGPSMRELLARVSTRERF